MNKWEYATEIGTFEGTNELLKELNARGEEGWEAVGITAEPEGEDTGYTVLLKREKKRTSTSATW